MCRGADNPSGLKFITEAMDGEIFLDMVGERSGRRRRRSGSSAGADGSENAGMSSARAVKICSTESLRVPRQGSSASG